MKRLLSFLMLWIAFAYMTNAQETVLTGKVTTQEDDSPLVGVSVVVKGTTTGVITNIDGEYSISVPQGSTVAFSFIGFIAEEYVITNQTTLDVALVPDLKQLEEVVVTAFGIEKKARSLTYATQELDGSDLTTVKDLNMINNLAGKSAGVVITKNGAGVGGSSKVILRGNTSISGNNQPLYVIDGVPMNNATGDQADGLYLAFDGGDAISNLNPDDIESINVLKGASAAALYGSQAANGVIMINTKKGQEGTVRVNYSLTTTFENAVSLPEVQTKYGQTAEGVWASWGPENESASDAHITDFWQTGVNVINSLSITSGNEKGQFYLSYANTKAKGIVETNELVKHNLSFQGTTHAYNNKLTLNAGFNYIQQEIENRPYGGYYHNPALSVYLFPIGDDFSQYKEYETLDPTRNIMAQNWGYASSGGVSFQNPYWISNRNPNLNLRNRYLVNLKGQFEFTDYLSLAARMNLDRTTDDFEQHLYATSDALFTSENGEYTKSTSAANQLYTDVLLNFNKDLTDDVNLGATVGFNTVINDNQFAYMSTTSDRRTGATPQTGLHFVNVFTMENMRGNFPKYETSTESFAQALFGTAQVGYKNMLFVDVTGRQEWSSTMSSTGSSTFFYPSAGLTFVLSELMNESPILSYTKLRGSYSEVGNALPFGLANKQVTYNVGTDGSVARVSALPAPGQELVPERTKSIELGADFRFLNNSLTLDVTYYNALTVDQFFTIQAPAGNELGVQNFYVNGGEIRNSGIELVLGYKLRTQSGFIWESNINFSKNTNKVEKISDDLEGKRVVLNSFTNTKIYTLVVEEGGSYGDMYGKGWQRTADGLIAVDDSLGNPLPTENDDVFLGNANPDYLWGFNNKFSFKGVSLSFLIDARIGGKAISRTQALMDGKGFSKRTGDDRDANATVIGSQTFSPQAFYEIAGGGDPISEQYTYSATNIRLRELSLGYTFPKSLFGDVINDLTLSFIGRNLFFLMNDAPFDPEIGISAGNGLQGLDAFNLPATRSFGFNLKVSF